MLNSLSEVARGDMKSTISLLRDILDKLELSVHCEQYQDVLNRMVQVQRSARVLLNHREEVEGAITGRFQDELAAILQHPIVIQQVGQKHLLRIWDTVVGLISVEDRQYTGLAFFRFSSDIAQVNPCLRVCPILGTYFQTTIARYFEQAGYTIAKLLGAERPSLACSTIQSPLYQPGVQENSEPTVVMMSGR